MLCLKKFNPVRTLFLLGRTFLEGRWEKLVTRRSRYSFLKTICYSKSFDVETFAMPYRYRFFAQCYAPLLNAPHCF